MTSLFFILGSFLILFSCNESETCIEEIPGLYSYQVLSSSDNGGIDVSGGSTSNARIEKVEDINEDLVLLESYASVTDGLTCITSFKFLYDMESKVVEAIEEVTFGCDTIVIWDKNVLDLSLEINPLSYDLTNISGELRGNITDSLSNTREILFVFEEIPICFE